MRAHAAVAVLLFLPLAACGGGLSKAELVKKGDAICKRVNDRVAKEQEPTNAADLAALAKKTVKISDPAIDDMEALEPPDELKKTFDAFVASLKHQRDLTKQIGDAAGKGDTVKIQQIATQAQKAQTEYRKLSDKIGFKECGGSN
jgi:hypothetical protein